MLGGSLSSPVLTGWRSIHLIQWTFIIWVGPPLRSFAYTAGCKGDLSDHINRATRSCGRSDLDVLKISTVYKMYSTTVICLFWARDSLCVAYRFWLPCHISKMLWALAILWNILSSTSFFNSESYSVFVKSTARSLWAGILLYASANCLKLTVS
jgi:hypothetical protein